MMFPSKVLSWVGEIARATMHLQVRAIIVFWIDAEIARGTGHDLGEAEGADRRAGARIVKRLSCQISACSRARH